MFSPSSFSTVDPINASHFSCNYTKLYCTFAALNKSVKTFDGLDHQYTPEKYLHRIDAHNFSTKGEQPIDHIFDGRNEKWHIYNVCYLDSF